MFWGLPDPDPLVGGMDPDPTPDPTPLFIDLKNAKNICLNIFFL